MKVKERKDLVNQVLRNAEILIGAKGWRQGVRPLQGKGVCASEAISIAGVDLQGIQHINKIDIIYYASKKLLYYIGDFDRIALWNDTIGRTEGEVRKTLIDVSLLK